MTPTLGGRVAIVTGASRNVGRAIARAFAGAGAQVVCAGRDADRLAATVDSITAAGGTAIPAVTDVTDADDVRALVGTALAHFGQLDVMAAIAGGGATGQPIAEVTPSDWDVVLRTNLTSTFLCAQAALPPFRARGGRGVILTCTGGGAFHPVPGASLLPYACAKAAVARFTDQLTAELLDTDIRVNALDPGQAWDDEHLAAVEAEERRTGTPHPLRPHHRPAEPHAAELALWLASDASRPLRGRCLSVYDDWRHDPARVAAVDATVHLCRLRRHDP